MINSDNKTYAPVERFHDAVDILDKFSTVLLFELAKNASTTKDIIIRNFIARSIVSLKGIMKLWDLKDYHDCWILFRKEFKDRLNPDFYTDTVQQKEKYNDICKEKVEWKRPKPETIAKQMHLDFLFKYGYDYASKLVHPMANDGQEDFYIQLDLPEINKFPDNISVLQNSCLVVKLIIQEGLNISSFRWREGMFDFLDNFIKFIDIGALDCLNDFKQVARHYEAGNLSEPSQIKK